MAFVDENKNYQLGKRKRLEEFNYPSCTNNTTKRNGVAIGQSAQVSFVISAHASSVRKDNYNNWGPQLAWTGHSYKHMGFFSSKREMKPWLKLHLKPIHISSITIINRKDCNGEKLRNVEVCAGMSPDLAEPEDVMGTFQGPGITGAEHSILFDRPVMVEFMIFQMMERGVLHINGIKINTITSEVECNQQNLAQHNINPVHSFCSCGEKASKKCTHKSCLKCCNDQTDKCHIHNKNKVCPPCSCGQEASVKCPQKSCARCCNDQTCEKHVMYRTCRLCGNDKCHTIKKCPNNCCIKCCDVKSCPTHFNLCTCGQRPTKECTNNECAKCCDDKTCLRHQKHCHYRSCGNTTSIECRNMRCRKCCKDHLCEYHWIEIYCSCGKVVTDNCSKKSCPLCCDDDSCETHLSFCPCGNMATRSCPQKRCDECCSLCVTHWNKHVTGNAGVVGDFVSSENICSPSHENSSLHAAYSVQSQESLETRKPSVSVSLSDSSHTTVPCSSDDHPVVQLHTENEERNEDKFYVQYPLSQVYDEKYIRGLFEPFCVLKHITRMDRGWACVTLEDDVTFESYDRIYVNLVRKCNRETTDSVYIGTYKEYLKKKKSEQLKNIFTNIFTENNNSVEITMVSGSSDGENRTADEDGVNGFEF